jgi:hypothetical protein
MNLMRWQLKHLIFLAALIVVAGSQTGCVNVKPWQRKTLADPTMSGELDPLSHDFADHIFFSREMASGGEGVGGGGCGCN